MSCVSCFAGDDVEVFSREEALAGRLIDNVLNGSVSYDSFSVDLLDETRSDFNSDKLDQVRKFVSAEFGTVSDVKLLSYGRRVDASGNYIGFDDIVFLGKTSKGWNIVFVFGLVDVMGEPKAAVIHISKAGLTPVASSK